jgi:hypothetical protein
MKITRDNYEVFFLDYLDGNLKEQDMDQFLDFLEQHADLREELNLLEHVRLPEEMAVMQGKNQLYKTREEELAADDNKLVAYLEGDMEEDHRKKFESYLAGNPELRKEYSVFEQTRLQPDPAIHFTHKKKLFKKPASVVVMNWVARAAAVVVVVWGVSLFFGSRQSPETILSTPEMVQLSTKPEAQGKTAKAEAQSVNPEIQEKKTTGIAPPSEKIKSAEKEISPEKHPEPMPEQVPAERELLALSELRPLGVQLQEHGPEVQLAFARLPQTESVQELPKEMVIPEFLSDRVKRVENEGVRSFQRLARLGLGVVSEISGDRISYSEKDGKISSVEFESKLVAFTIPLGKK